MPTLTLPDLLDDQLPQRVFDDTTDIEEVPEPFDDDYREPDDPEPFYDSADDDDPIMVHDIAVGVVKGPASACLPEYEPDNLRVVVPHNQPPKIITKEDSDTVVVPAY